MIAVKKPITPRDTKKQSQPGEKKKHDNLIRYFC